VTDPFGGLPQPPAPPAPPRRRLPPATTALIGLCALAFAGQAILGHDLQVIDPVALFRMGANFAPAILDGDWWRLGACVFLHIGWLHFLSNMFSLWYIASEQEMIFGSNLTLGFFAATGLASSLAALGWGLSHPAIVAGASGAIFGLLGATVAFLFRIRSRIAPQERAEIRRRLFVTFLLNVAVAFSFPVSTAAHLGGLFAGFVLGLLAPHRALPPRFWQKPTRWFVIGCVLVLASMAGAAVARAVKPKPRELRGNGAEAKIDGLFIPVEPGIADLPGAARLRISREKSPPPAGAGVQMGGRTWVRDQVEKDVERLSTEDGSGSLVIELGGCDQPICKGDSGEKLLDLTARSLRASP
jgi:membrane associated rhomboid family serine protease